jgi:hypothetical protein
MPSDSVPAYPARLQRPLEFVALRYQFAEPGKALVNANRRIPELVEGIHQL